MEHKHRKSCNKLGDYVEPFRKKIPTGRVWQMFTFTAGNSKIKTKRDGNDTALWGCKMLTGVG